MRQNRKRDTAITIRGTADEIGQIKANAKQSKLNLTAFILRACINGKVEKINNFDDVTGQIRAIGNNINQIARKANYYNEIQAEEIRETTGELNKIWQLLRQLQAGQDLKPQ